MIVQTAVRFDTIPRLLRDQRWRHDPAVIALFGRIAIEPIPTRPRFVDKDEAFGLRLQLPYKFIEVALARADGAKLDDGGVVVFRGIGHCDGFFMDIHSDVERARLWQG